jgi:hypothetical protein
MCFTKQNQQDDCAHIIREESSINSVGDLSTVGKGGKQMNDHMEGFTGSFNILQNNSVNSKKGKEVVNDDERMTWVAISWLTWKIF